MNVLFRDTANRQLLREGHGLRRHHVADAGIAAVPQRNLHDLRLEQEDAVPISPALDAGCPDAEVDAVAGVELGVVYNGTVLDEVVGTRVARGGEVHFEAPQLLRSRLGAHLELEAERGARSPALISYFHRRKNGVLVDQHLAQDGDELRRVRLDLLDRQRLAVVEAHAVPYVVRVREGDENDRGHEVGVQVAESHRDGREQRSPGDHDGLRRDAPQERHGDDGEQPRGDREQAREHREHAVLPLYVVFELFARRVEVLQRLVHHRNVDLPVPREVEQTHDGVALLGDEERTHLLGGQESGVVVLSTVELVVGSDDVGGVLGLPPLPLRHIHETAPELLQVQNRYGAVVLAPALEGRGTQPCRGFRHLCPLRYNVRLALHHSVGGRGLERYVVGFAPRPFGTATVVRWFDIRNEHCGPACGDGAVAADGGRRRAARHLVVQNAVTRRGIQTAVRCKRTQLRERREHLLEQQRRAGRNHVVSLQRDVLVQQRHHRRHPNDVVDEQPVGKRRGRRLLNHDVGALRRHAEVLLGAEVLHVLRVVGPAEQLQRVLVLEFSGFQVGALDHGKYLVPVALTRERRLQFADELRLGHDQREPVDVELANVGVEFEVLFEHFVRVHEQVQLEGEGYDRERDAPDGEDDVHVYCARDPGQSVFPEY
ncbi:ABC transporter permease [Babesia caballi]|uniref:ABC transporter permease n=1 Tax=Babesia caballi TaxID=5871 RepID=A0AAV4LW94_BABCB|nr:ABC transporter permease [Babesia caballi]